MLSKALLSKGTPCVPPRFSKTNPWTSVPCRVQGRPGWSGKPRNVGIAAAKGEYVQFVDNDDWLGDEALERMYNYAIENKADVVVGKMAGKGRPVPRELFRKNRPHANVDNAPL